MHASIVTQTLPDTYLYWYYGCCARWDYTYEETQMSKQVEAVLELKEQHKQTWRDKSEWFWLLGLLEEVIELSASLVGLHKGPVEWELTQIAAICMNWLEHRKGK